MDLTSWASTKCRTDIDDIESFPPMSTSSHRHSICMLSDDFLPAATGVGTHVQRISEDLARRGHRVCVITSRRHGEPAQEQWRGVSVYRSFTVKLFGFYQALPSPATIRRIFEENGVTIAHFHYLGVMLKRAEKVARRLAIPRVYTYHMTADHLTQPWPMKPLRPWIARQIVDYCNRFDLVITPSRDLIESIRQDGVLTRTQYISNPVVFAPAEGVQPVERPGAFVVLYAGRLNPEKNLPLLLEGFRGLLQRVPDAVLWIAGAGDQRERLESTCRSLAISEKVRFLGFISHDQLARHYAACDVFVLPSLVEIQPLVAMEAMHFGKPVIVTRAIVSARELVDDGVNGFIVDPAQPSELTDRLFLLASRPDLRRQLGAAAQRRSLDFAPEQVLDAIEAAYDSLIPQQ
ncbi:MAG: glycosyltransferase [Rubrivivax sp.]|nr:glycosyltransferase [Rubrivivax sp.]